ncbi:MAG: hypothetical protein IJ939_03310 [Clostridia bacterium]|nr:hypothetical protein [Clostridia bacterium]
MANNWKYATLSDRERLKMIRNGDTDVYNAEMEMSRILRKNRNEAGLSTDYIDSWENAVRDAYAGALAKQNESTRIKYHSPAISAANSAYTKAMKILREEKAEAIKDATEQAESARDNLSEWLANNGFSDEGSTAKKEREELEKSIADLLEQVKAQYRAKAEKTRRDYFSPFLS